MDVSVTLVNLAGAVALLLWGVHMVQTGCNARSAPGAGCWGSRCATACRRSYPQHPI
jgi:hypothetical protein